jgi:hypothetical protein
MELAGVTYFDGRGFAVAEMSETVTLDGSPLVTPEALLFDFDEHRFIAGVEIVTRGA